MEKRIKNGEGRIQGKVKYSKYLKVVRK